MGKIDEWQSLVQRLSEVSAKTDVNPWEYHADVGRATPM